MVDSNDQGPDVEGSRPKSRSGDAGKAPSDPSGDAPTARTPLGAAALWRLLLKLPQQLPARSLDELAVKPERWGNYTEVAALMGRLSLTQMPVETTSRAERVAYVRFVDGDVDWFLTTVRGVDGLWRVWDLTKGRKPPATEIFG